MKEDTGGWAVTFEEWFQDRIDQAPDPHTAAHVEYQREMAEEAWFAMAERAARICEEMAEERGKEAHRLREAGESFEANWVAEQSYQLLLAAARIQGKEAKP